MWEILSVYSEARLTLCFRTQRGADYRTGGTGWTEPRHAMASAELRNAQPKLEKKRERERERERDRDRDRDRVRVRKLVRSKVSVVRAARTWTPSQVKPPRWRTIEVILPEREKEREREREKSQLETGGNLFAFKASVRGERAWLNWRPPPIGKPVAGSERNLPDELVEVMRRARTGSHARPG